MEALAQAIRYLNVLIFALLAFRSAQFRVRRDRPALWSALMFAALAILFGARILEDFLVEGSPLSRGVDKLTVAAAVLFPYFLFRFVASFARLARALEALAAVGVAIALGWGLTLPEIPEGERPAWLLVYIVVILSVWLTLTGVAVVRLWRAGRGQPAVVRKRIRLMASAAAVLSLAILIAALGPGERPPTLDVVYRLTIFTSAVLFFTAFAPPVLIRAIWRRRAVERMQAAVVDLMSADDERQVIERLLPHVADVLGAGAAVLGPGGEVLGPHDLDERHLQDAVDLENDRDGQRAAPGERLHVLALSFGRLVVAVSPYTPFFGREEFELLSFLGSVADLAVQRTRAAALEARVAEAELRRRQALEINDNIVQGLAVAKYALELGQDERARRAIEGTLAAARAIVSGLLDEVSPELGMLGPGSLVREEPASGRGTQERG